MPHIVISGTNMNAQIQHVSIQAYVMLNDSVKFPNWKLKLIKDDLDNLLSKYFDNTEYEILSDQEYKDKN